MSQLTVSELKPAIERLSLHAAQSQELLCQADAQLGDGDLGISVADGWRQAAEDSAQFSDDLGNAFFLLSKSFQKASPSSFGTLMATAFMAAAKQSKGKTVLTAADLSPLLRAACDAMMQRGKGELGQKSVLDIVDALANGLSDVNDLSEAKHRAVNIAQQTLDAFRPQANKLGRARMFPEKSCGLDDPGMLAIKVMIEAL
jgi:dihydroxyacetone kinase-like protein